MTRTDTTTKGNEMTQQKLTEYGLQAAVNARFAVKVLLQFVDYKDYWGKVLRDLDELASHGTTDGKPLQNPQPEIEEGFRLATEEDEGRKDREVFNGQRWFGAVCNYRYTSKVCRVPIDRIPTDEDAKQRPTVMVRDRENRPWMASVLLGVVPEYEYQFASNMCGVTVTHRMARFPYYGELE